MKTSEILNHIFPKDAEGVRGYSVNRARYLYNKGRATAFELSRANWLGIVKQYHHPDKYYATRIRLCGYCFQAVCDHYTEEGMMWPNDADICKFCIFDNDCTYGKDGESVFSVMEPLDVLKHIVNKAKTVKSKR